MQKISLAVSTYSFLAINVDRLMAMKLPWVYRLVSTYFFLAINVSG